MKIYICGKIGEDRPSPETLAKFKKAEDMLKSKGHEVFNPTSSGLGAHAESLALKNGTSFWQEILILDLEELKVCDAIYILEDWKSSDGAQTEYYYAKGAGKRFFFQEHWDANNHLSEILKQSWRTGRPLSLPENGESDFDCVLRFQRKHINEVWLP